jgi:N-hydroxyarylamine O-acetyltransferase
MAAAMDTPIDLEAYFRRIEYSGPRTIDAETFKSLHVAHAMHIPFENVDVLNGKPIRLDLPSLQAKLVRGRRGGYCFEQNMLFAAVLEQLGFAVARLQARVRWGTDRVLPRTHMVLEVDVAGRPWLADVGFGGWGLLEPVSLAEGESRQFDWSYRLCREGDVWMLQTPQVHVWQNLYAFTRESQLSVDFEPGNYYVSNHPDSRFVQTLTAQRVTPTARYVLRGRELIVASADTTTTRTLDRDEELIDVLAEQFGLVLAPGPWIPRPAIGTGS